MIQKAGIYQTKLAVPTAPHQIKHQPQLQLLEQSITGDANRGARNTTRQMPNQNPISWSSANQDMHITGSSTPHLQPTTYANELPTYLAVHMGLCSTLYHDLV